MTDTDLRDLFHAAGGDLDGPDPVAIDRAWRDGTRRRLGSRAAVLGSVAAVAVTVVVSGMLGGSVERVQPTPAVDTPTSTPSTSAPTSTPATSAPPTKGAAPVARPAGHYAGAPVWLAPSVTEEADLPLLPGVVAPPVIDLDTAEAGPIDEPVVALFAGQGEQAFALTASRRVVEIDTSQLDPVTDEGGNPRNPLSYYSLSGDGLGIFFIQNSSLEVLDVMTGEWTSVETPDWLAEGARWMESGRIWVPDVRGGDSAGTVHDVATGTTSVSVIDWVRGWAGPGDGQWGPVAWAGAGTAQAAFLVGPVSGGTLSNPQALMVELFGGGVAARDGERQVLALDYGGPGEGTRGKGCCIALGWLDADTVLFSSSGTEGQRILAWDVGTEAIYRVTEILGPASIVALAALS